MSHGASINMHTDYDTDALVAWYVWRRHTKAVFKHGSDKLKLKKMQLR